MPRKEVELSEAIDELLAAAAPTLEQLAEEAGVSYAALRSWREPGGRKPRTETLERLLAHLEGRSSRIAQLAEQARRARARNPERRKRRRPPSE